MNYEFDWKQYARLARQAAAEGCVLLKNENRALPIKDGETVSVFGRIQFDYLKSGTGSGGMVNAPYVVSILDGLRACETIGINQELLNVYEKWVEKNPFDMGAGWAQEPWCQKEMPVTEELVKKAAEKSDIAIIIIGRTAGEDKDNSVTRGSYLLTKEEEQLLEEVCKGFQRVAVVLNVGNIIDMEWMEQYGPQAVLYTWQGGMEGGNAVADILTGKVNPCGKLSDTIAKDIKDYPSDKNFGGETRNIYAEDIYVGYRYFETMAKESVKYPFGYGLSYTEFTCETTYFQAEGDKISLGVKVRNTGSTAGKEVVQIYYCPPQGRLGKPLRNLIRFAKTRLLDPGEHTELSFTISVKEFASYDDGGATGHKSCYVLETGTYEIYAGTDVRSAVYAGEVVRKVLEVVETFSEAAAPVTEFKRMKPEMNSQGNYEAIEEKVPLRTVDLMERIRENRPVEEIYTGDQGYKLADVYDKKITLMEFLFQLTDDDLIHMTRGEGMCSPKVTPGTAAAFGGVTENLQGFGIPAACCADGPGGIRMDCGSKAFSLPNGTALACSFNLELVEHLYEMEGLELRKNQVDTLLGPGMNIHRNPLNGRNFEYFSEDPYVSGKMAAAELKGMHKYGVTGTIKHFACNNQEYKRHDTDAVISERALREIYLKGYEIAVKEGGAYSIMSTYGALNGLWTAGNYDLLTTILRKEWGYEGMVMTDWWAKINEEGKDAATENTIPMVRAQNDVYMVVADALKNTGNDNTREGVRDGRITRAELLRNAANITAVILKYPVMERFLGRNTEEWTIRNEVQEQDDKTVKKEKITVWEEGLLDTTGIVTQKGNSMQYILEIPQKGVYTLSFQMKSYAGELAQMPMSVFMNNQLIKTITINGTDGKWVKKEAEIEVSAMLDNYLKLYFGESGIEMGEIKIRRNMQKAIAYVTVPVSENWRWIGKDGEDEVISGVDTRYVTHINFAFGMIEALQFEKGKPGCPIKEGSIASREAYKDTKDGTYHYRATLQGWIEEMDAKVDGRKYLRALTALKKEKPELKVLLSIGGWDSDGFCYMARERDSRREFIESCIALMKEYNLDGIDLDWEYPTNGGWGEIASCDHCIEDARKLIQEFREAFDQEFSPEHKLLSIASGMTQPWVDQKTLDAMDYVNVMCYDYNPGAGGSQAGMEVAAEGMAINVGYCKDTPENRKKFNLGVPFYNDAGQNLVPYYKEWKGHVDASPEILREKMEWVKAQGFGGAFYWAYSMDVFEQDVKDPSDPEIKILQKTLYETLN